MAQGFVLRCTGCAKTVEVSDEGHPYYEDPSGQRVYAYHPDPERDFCTGVESDCMCMNCGHEMRQDVDGLLVPCGECGSLNVLDVSLLEGKGCPGCGGGVFRVVEGSERIS